MVVFQEAILSAHQSRVKQNRVHPILHTIQGRMNACQHCVPICIKRKGKKKKLREALQNRIGQKTPSSRRKGCQTSTVMTPSRGALALDLPVQTASQHCGSVPFSMNVVECPRIGSTDLDVLSCKVFGGADLEH